MARARSPFVVFRFLLIRVREFDGLRVKPKARGEVVAHRQQSNPIQPDRTPAASPPRSNAGWPDRECAANTHRAKTAGLNSGFPAQDDDGMNGSTVRLRWFFEQEWPARLRLASLGDEGGLVRGAFVGCVPGGMR